MGEKIVVGPTNKGLVNNRTAFNIDNDAFPKLENAYQWRGRVKRKRGTSTLGRLTRYFDSNSTSYSSTATIALAGGAANIITGFSLQTNGALVPGSVTVINTSVAQTYTDNSLGVLTGSIGGTGTVNYATGAITITGGAGNSIRVTFLYYPDLPVMGLEDFILSTALFPACIAFDTTYAYNINVTSPYSIYSISFYKNPPAAPPTNYTNYVAKTTVTPVTWNGQDYQQFWTTNYEGALWATNGITAPFTTTNIGMQYKAIVATTVNAGGPPAVVNLQITGHGLVVGDFVFVNEVATTTGINFQTGYVTTVTDANNVIVTFPNATIASNGAGGIAQYLTSRSDTSKDCIRWYDGDPTNGNASTPTLNGGKGWVNFCPPLSQGSFSIAGTPSAQYYLVGARMIIPFKDRLLFIGPVIQTSSASSQVYLQDTVIYSQNGTPYYTASYTNTPSATVDTPASASNVFHPILTPANKSATSPSWFEDQSGFGGFFTSGLNQPINSTSTNEDVLIFGFDTLQARFVYTGNDLIPFNMFVINSEYGTSSTFSVINMDKGVMTKGDRGFIVSSQTGCQRADLQIPDEVFQFSLLANGNQRVCAQRDFIEEWIYFTYRNDSVSSSIYKFPNQTLFYNYRDDSWGVFTENYTTYGLFRKATGETWGTLPSTLTWGTWTSPWNSGETNLLSPEVIAGNQQGFVLFRDGEGTSEGTSLYIKSISSYTLTVPDHGLNENDYIIISGSIGTTNINGHIWQVIAPIAQNTFTIASTETPAIVPSGTYLGGGLIQRMYIPYIQTKQFPVSWEMARKTRLGTQQYLLSTTSRSQVTLLIFLSEDGTNPYNSGPIVPDMSFNNSLVYSSVLYTCPESTNLGLTAANINLQMVTATEQAQIWHRINTSLLGDTVQVAITISPSQMTQIDSNGIPVNAFDEVELHTIILDVSPSMILA